MFIIPLQVSEVMKLFLTMLSSILKAAETLIAFHNTSSETRKIAKRTLTAMEEKTSRYRS